MARKKDQQQEEEGGDEVTRELISKPKLKSLMNTVRKAKIDIGEINGAVGQEIKEKIENNHLHRRAFNACKPLMNLTAEQLAEFKDNFEYYWEALGLEAKANSAPRLPMGEEEGDEEGTDGGSKVHKFPGQQAAAE